MSKDNSDSFKLSRRKALAAMGSIGAAGALGVGGTWAQFTDSEAESVTFSAGGIDGTVMGRSSYNGQDVSTFSDDFSVETVPANVSETEQGALGLGIELTDVKPGDYGCFAFKITVTNNPAWVAACLGYHGDIDALNYEPEIDAEGEDNVTTSNVNATTGELLPGIEEDEGEYVTEGDLAENILTIPFYKGGSAPSSDEFDPCIFFDAEEDAFDTEGYEGSNAVSTPTQFWSNSEDGLLPHTLQDAAEMTMIDTMSWGDDEVVSEQLYSEDSIAVGPGCVFLNGDNPSNENQQGAAPLQPGDEIWMGWDWHLPFNVGNEAQGDSITLDFGFVFGQVRHTENAQLSNIYAPGQNLPADE